MRITAQSVPFSEVILYGICNVEEAEERQKAVSLAFTWCIHKVERPPGLRA